MFNKSNFCHIASNNRNEQKGSVFIYKTTDTLAQVTQSGYFNEKLIDINLHDLIIHVQYNQVNRTLKKSVLIVTERTMDNVATQPITDETILNDIGDLGDQVAEIEGKIPSDASSTNQLATQKDITNKITNCITQIPQDIKLELNNGTLTIKAGSKIYYPNGSGVFNKVVLTTDKTYTDSTKTGQWFICLTQGLAGTVGSVANSVSGTSQPTAGFSLWYNTEENIMYRYGSITDAPASNISLPIAIITLNNTGVASIDQVFNGFGYIGSTLFALPGVKGLVPSGRNEDGTLKNSIVTISNVSTYTKSGNFDKWGVYISNGGRLYTIINSFGYNERENLIRNTTDGTPFGVFQCGTATSVNNVISLETKTTFHAVDYNDTEFIARQVIASDRYIDLTLGTSGASYTAPADGWLVLNKLSSGTSYQFVQFYNTKNLDRRIGAATTNNAYLCATMPLAKGDRVLVEYSATGDTKLFRFIYANGAK